MMPNEIDSCFEPCASGSNHSADHMVGKVRTATTAGNLPGCQI